MGIKHNSASHSEYSYAQFGLGGKYSVVRLCEYKARKAERRRLDLQSPENPSLFSNQIVYSYPFHEFSFLLYPMSDQPKAIISNRLTDVLGWHIWTILALTGTTILLYLNFKEYPIGGEIGGSQISSANIVGILQVVIKVHELVIVASLVAIAHQLTLRSLMSSGLLLGLLGVEGSLATPSFLVSAQFWHALGFGFRSIYSPSKLGNGPDRPVRIRMLGLAFFYFLSCMIASLAGPASGVLMIPRVDWFHYGTYKFQPEVLSTLPNIMIGTSPGFLDGDSFSESNVFALTDQIIGSGLRYWMDTSGYELRSPKVPLEEQSQHRFHDIFGPVYVNTTGWDNRTLDAEWCGETKITTSARNIDDLFIDSNDIPQFPKIKKGWTGLKSVDTSHGFDARVTCRAREKTACTEGSVLSGNTSNPDWCYLSVNKNNTSGTLRTSRNLLMAHDFEDDTDGPRLWLTEGPRIKGNSHYSDSIEVVFEDPITTELAPYVHNLTVCSFSVSLVAAIATSSGASYGAEKVEYFNYVFLPDGKIAEPRKFLFHENWLDRAYSYDPSLWSSIPVYNQVLPEDTVNLSYPTGSMAYPDNFTYPERPGLSPMKNLFGQFGSNLILATGNFGPPEDRAKAFPVEVTVGGLLTYLLSWSLPSESQYSMPYEQIPERFRLDPPQSYYPHVYFRELYRRGYGFRLSTRTAYLGVSVLLAHAVIAISASLWQLKRASVIYAWETVPDYAMLGSGSPSLAISHPNTCARVTGTESLQGLVKVAERIPPPGALPPAPIISHLELVAVDYSEMAATIPVDLTNTEKKFG